MSISILAGNPRILSPEDVLQPQELSFRYGLHRARHQKNAGNDVRVSVLLDHTGSFDRFLEGTSVPYTLSLLQERYRKEFEALSEDFGITPEEILMMPEQELRIVAHSLRTRFRTYECLVRNANDSCGTSELAIPTQCREITAGALWVMEQKRPERLETIWQGAEHTRSDVMNDGARIAVSALGVKRVDQTFLRQKGDGIILEESTFTRGGKNSDELFDVDVQQRPAQRMKRSEFDELIRSDH